MLSGATTLKSIFLQIKQEFIVIVKQIATDGQRLQQPEILGQNREIWLKKIQIKTEHNQAGN